MPEQPEQTVNLLPPERARGVRRNYFFRLGSLCALLLGILAIAHGILLVPAYAYISQDIQAKEVRLDSLAATKPGENSATARLSTLTNDATYLGRLATTPTMSGATALVLSVPHSGITLSTFTLAPASGNASLIMTIGGLAKTREALHSYVLALQAQPWIKSADLPLSAYAADTNVTFTITLVGTFVSS